jgi:hypothetical protein
MMGLQDTVTKWWPQRHSKSVISIEYPDQTFGEFAKAQIREALQARRELMKNYIIVYDETYCHPSDFADSRGIPELCTVSNPTAAAA